MSQSLALLRHDKMPLGNGIGAGGMMFIVAAEGLFYAARPRFPSLATGIVIPNRRTWDYVKVIGGEGSTNKLEKEEEIVIPYNHVFYVSLLGGRKLRPPRKSEPIKINTI